MASEEQEKKFMKKCKDEESSWWPSHLESGGEHKENAPEVGVEPEKDAVPVHLENEDGKNHASEQNDTEPEDVVSMDDEEKEHPYEKLEDDAAHNVQEHLKGNKQEDLKAVGKEGVRATDVSEDASRQHPSHLGRTLSALSSLSFDRSRERSPEWRKDLA